MDKFEFELRYLAYQGMSRTYKLWRSQEEILEMVKKTDKWGLTKSIQDHSLDELWELTRLTYSNDKIALLKKHTTSTIKNKWLVEYIERLEYELKAIDAMGYNTYFLVVQDYINWAKEQDIMVGPGRWSVAGSLLSYVIWITDLDPLDYDLIFERFLNPGRITMPDIDTDFEDTLRDKVIDYIKLTYGDDKVAHIGTYMTLAAKAAFKDVARVFWVKFEQSNKISALVTEKTVAASIEANKELKQLAESDQRIKNVLEIAIKIEGTVRQTWVHACGIIIAPQPVVEYSPIQYPPKSGSKDSRDESRIVSQYEGPIIEDLGLLKMDILGLRNLSVIKHCIRIITARAKKDNRPLDPMFSEFNETMLFHPPMDDESTYKKIFWPGDMSGIFQFESDGMKGWMRKLKPTAFDDLIAMVSLYRPWPMDYIPHYVDRKYGVEKISYMEHELHDIITNKYGENVAESEKEKLTEDLAPFLGITYGIPVYQEQLMRLVQAMAGFSMAEADKLRKWVGKKIREVIEKIKVEFVQKAAEHRWYKPETSQWIYEKMIEPAADYSFNKSHAACYAYIAYQTARLKAHYSIEFHAALLRAVEEDTDKLAKFIDEIKLQGYTVKLPDINNSYEHVAAVGDAIQLWFSSIKGIGSDIAANIEAEREENGKYSSLTDFLTRCWASINKKSLEALIKSGALDIYNDRLTLLTNISTILDWVKSAGHQKSNWGGLFDMGAVQWADLVFKPGPQASLMETIKTEFEVFKTLISCHPFDGLYSYIKPNYNFISMFAGKEKFGEFKILAFIKSINRWMRGGFFMRVEDISGETEFYLQDRLDLEPFDIITIKGYKGQRTPKIDEIKVYELETLIQKARDAGKYKENETVASVRKERFAQQAAQHGSQALLHSDFQVAETQLEDASTLEVLAEDELADSGEKPMIQSYTFATPEQTSVLSKIPQIIKKHKWEIPITIGKLHASVSPEGLKAIKALLS